MSAEAIYQHIYAMPRGELARRGIFLQSKRTKRRPRTTGRYRGGVIVGMVPLSERGQDAAERRVPGHWEGDLTIGKNGASCAATLVERMSGFTGLLALPSKQAEPTADAVIEYFNELTQMMKASLAWDQGSEMAQHAKVSLATSMPVYFADPHSPWQRPSNENTNRLYREYLPKGTVIPDHQPYLTTIAEEINNRPRRRLGYLTPDQARLLADYDKLLAQISDLENRQAAYRHYRKELDKLDIDRIEFTPIPMAHPRRPRRSQRRRHHHIHVQGR
ncbi:IS30 family transposase [Corynebacterium yudongzhengii]|uniref:IS30 family transposase n=1 Tax=Corynebacterium yudongzhengii TaxID=2080740 RepID=UPI001F2ED6FD|nr:IS30 family transposase [Corynebacterium yudongzhengii]